MEAQGRNSMMRAFLADEEGCSQFKCHDGSSSGPGGRGGGAPSLSAMIDQA